MCAEEIDPAVPLIILLKLMSDIPVDTLAETLLWLLELMELKPGLSDRAQGLAGGDNTAPRIDGIRSNAAFIIMRPPLL